MMQLIIVMVFMLLQHHALALKMHWAVEISDGLVEANRIAEKYGLVNLGQVGELENIYHFVIHSGKRRFLSRRISQLKHEPKVKGVELQRIKYHQKKPVTSPSDPLWEKQWQLFNTGQLGRSGLDLNVEPVWKQGITGRGVTVAVVDDGLEYNHTDLSKNYDPSSSYDFADTDSDPRPFSILTFADQHGTNCAGIVAMRRDNGQCGVGVAYNARIAGIRLITFQGTTDYQEALAMMYKYNQNDIYTNSWGPRDYGYTVDGPGLTTRSALDMGVRKGRNGKGSIYVWAAGNGGHYDDSCVTDGYASSIYTIAVGSADFSGGPAFYDEKCSSKMVVVYNHGSSNNTQSVTTAAWGKCTRSFTGTSAAAPLLAGALALALQAKPSLTWRDVQYLLAYTSDFSKLTQVHDWTQNGAGLWYSHQSGFGAVDVKALVKGAKQWTSVPDQKEDDISLDVTGRFATYLHPLSINFTYPCQSGILYLEHVVVEVSLNISNPGQTYSLSNLRNAYEDDQNSVIYHHFARRGDIKIILTSPQGTPSTILPLRSRDFINNIGFTKWPLMSVHFWGENPAGRWTLSVSYQSQVGQVNLQDVRVVFYGTQTVPQAVGNISSLLSNTTACSIPIRTSTTSKTPVQPSPTSCTPVVTFPTASSADMMHMSPLPSARTTSALFPSPVTSTSGSDNVSHSSSASHTRSHAFYCITVILSLFCVVVIWCI